MRKRLNLSLRNIFAVLFLILYIYSIKFTFLPLTGKVLMGVVGIPLFFLNGEHPRRGYMATLFLVFAMVGWGFITVILNGTNEYLYNNYFLSFFSSFFAAYFIISLLKKKIFSMEDFLLLVVFACGIESLITAMMRFSPELQSFMFAIQEFQMKNASDQEMLNSFRLMGLGEAVYFGVLPTATLGLSSCCYIFLNTTSKQRKSTVIIFYILISIVSFLTARYSATIIAVTMFVTYWQYSAKLNTFGKIRYILLTGAGITFLVYMLINLLPDFIFEWAFSPFIEDGESRSSESMIEWWTNTRFNFVTFMIGDAQYDLADGYYMGTDVGYFRQIYYGGIIGLFFFILLHFKILKMCYKRYVESNFRCFLVMLFLSWLVMLTKGSKDMLDQYLLVLVAVDYLFVINIPKKHKQIVKFSKE